MNVGFTESPSPLAGGSKSTATRRLPQRGDCAAVGTHLPSTAIQREGRSRIHNVSFVSVTQQFNTTTSMGRLTLNVLLSFAQFEREVTSERIRDKIAASKRKGLWVGGMAPLGYETKDRTIVVVEEEAERVRTIFRTYLALGSLNRLLADLRQKEIVTKVRTLKSGRTVEGIPFTRGPLAYLLRNRFYIGEVVFRGEVFPGEQPAILDRDLFDAVQAKLSEQLNNHTTARADSNPR